MDCRAYGTQYQGSGCCCLSERCLLDNLRFNDSVLVGVVPEVVETGVGPLFLESLTTMSLFD